MESAGCLQVAQEELSPQLPHLCLGLFPACHHPLDTAATEHGEAAMDGAGAGGTVAGSAAAGDVPAGE